DHALRCHHEHRLMAAIAEDVDVLGAVDLPGRGLRRILRGGRSDSSYERGEHGETNRYLHLLLSGKNGEKARRISSSTQTLGGRIYSAASCRGPATGCGTSTFKCDPRASDPA